MKNNSPLPISQKTLAMMDKSVANFKLGKVSESINKDIEKLLKKIDNVENSEHFKTQKKKNKISG